MCLGSGYTIVLLGNNKVGGFMKRYINKKTIFSFIIGIFITSGISIGAVAIYNADEVSYKKIDNTETNVKIALDELSSTEAYYYNPNVTSGLSKYSLEGSTFYVSDTGFALKGVFAPETNLLWYAFG